MCVGAARARTRARSYEAFTIYNFVKMLYELLGGERAVIRALAAKKPMEPIFPLSVRRRRACGRASERERERER